jgi:hypothetical protein
MTSVGDPPEPVDDLHAPERLVHVWPAKLTDRRW